MNVDAADENADRIDKDSSPFIRGKECPFFPRALIAESITYAMTFRRLIAARGKTVYQHPDVSTSARELPGATNGYIRCERPRVN